MFICLVIKRFSFIVFLALIFSSDIGFACSCSWKGPFMTVARDAVIVVKGKIIRHNPGTKPSIDIHVNEVLSGAMLDSGMRILTGDGMHCRPDMSLFPPGTEWIIALNGPGAKAGNELAISHCGEYWLRVEGDEAVGSIYGKQGETGRVKLDSIRTFFRYPLFRQQLRGKVEKGGRFVVAFGTRFEFALEPAPEGWEIVIREQGRNENLARLTPPMHFMPNPRYLDSCHFTKPPENCPCAYGAESAPAFPRKFIFSPEVGKSIAGSGMAVGSEDVKKTELFGSGEFHVEKHEMETDSKGCPVIRSLKFRVYVSGGFKPEMIY